MLDIPPYSPPANTLFNVLHLPQQSASQILGTPETAINIKFSHSQFSRRAIWAVSSIATLTRHHWPAARATRLPNRGHPTYFPVTPAATVNTNTHELPQVDFTFSLFSTAPALHDVKLYFLLFLFSVVLFIFGVFDFDFDFVRDRTCGKQASSKSNQGIKARRTE